MRKERGCAVGKEDLQLVGKAGICWNSWEMVWPALTNVLAMQSTQTCAAGAAWVANIYWKWTACEIALETLHCGKTVERPKGSCWDHRSQMLLWKWVICCWSAACLVCGACPQCCPGRTIHGAGCWCCSRIVLTSSCFPLESLQQDLQVPPSAESVNW